MALAPVLVCGGAYLLPFARPRRAVPGGDAVAPVASCTTDKENKVIKEINVISYSESIGSNPPVRNR